MLIEAAIRTIIFCVLYSIYYLIFIRPRNAIQAATFKLEWDFTLGIVIGMIVNSL